MDGGTVGVKARVQPFRHLVQFQLHAVQHKQVFIPQPVHLRVKQWTQFFWVGRRNGKRAHAGEFAMARLAGQVPAPDAAVTEFFGP